MKALLISMGTRGDVEPFLALGEILLERGWEVVCLFPEQFRSESEQMGFRFHGFDKAFLELIDGIDAKRILGGEGSILKRFASWASLAKQGMKLARDSVDLQHRVTLDEAPDRVIYHPKCNTAIIWGMAKPGKSIMLSPIPGLYHVVRHFAVMWGNYGTTLNRASFWLVNKIKAIAVKRFTRSIQNDYPALRVTVSSIQRAMETTEKTFYTVSPSLFPRPVYWPDSARVVGYFERDKAAHWTPPDELEQFIATYEKIVFISFGSMTNPDPGTKTAIILNALKKHNIPAIIATAGGGLKRSDDSPAHVVFIKNVPHDWLFPQVYAVVHHGGSGTTHMAVKYGCPALVIPHAIDQPFWARTIHALGLGPKGIRIRDLNDEVFQSRLAELYTNKDYKDNALEFRRRMSQEGDRDELYRQIIN